MHDQIWSQPVLTKSIIPFNVRSLYLLNVPRIYVEKVQGKIADQI